MLNRFRAFFLSLTIVSMMMFSVYGTTIVYADDGTSTESTEVSAPSASAEESAPPSVVDSSTTQPEASAVAPDTTAQPEESPVATDATAEPGASAVVTEATAQPEESPVATDTTAQPEATAATEVSPEPTLEQLPDNTTVTVINSDGEVQPLATQDSADAIASAYDPIWCPEGQSPTPGANGCTSSFSSFTALLTYLQANESDPNYQQAGTIYIQNGQYLGGESSIVINPTPSATSLNNYNLTLQGGWNTVDNTTTDTTQFDIPIVIGTSGNPWIGSLTFNNILISGVNYQTGLTAYSNGDITVSNVEVTDSLAGANLSANGNILVTDSNFNDNKDAGANIHTGNKVDIKNSQFNGNGGFQHPGFGLQIQSGSAVSLDQVTASNNERFGADITATGKVSINNSVFSGNVEYRYYCSTCSHKFAIGGYGLQVVSIGDIALDGVTADNNYFFGANLDGANVHVLNGSFNNNGTGRLEESVGYGLMVKSDSALGVTLDNISANNNEQFGANIEANGDVVVRNSLFNGNQSYTYSCKGLTFHGYGLQVLTTGDISANSVTATNNVLFGGHLEGASIAVANSVFSNNGSGSSQYLTGRGLEIISTDTVGLSNVEANNNQKFGANITAVNNVNISGSFFNGNKVYSKGSVVGGGYGLDVFTTNGIINLSGVEANDNYLYGANLDGNAVVLGTGYFENNSSGADDKPVGYGLKVVSDESVSLVDIHANNNQLFGTDVQAGGSVSISNGFFSGHHAYTFNPCTGESHFYGYGLKVVTTGNITMNNVTANFNNLWGASLDGLDMSISNSQFNNNVTQHPVFIDDTGLLINSKGSVNLFNVEAKENRMIGANITATGYVSISGGSNFSDNQGTTCSDEWCKNVTYYGYGLKVVTPDGIFLGNVTADNNNLFGAHLEGSSVTIFDSTFDNNGSGDSKDPTGKGLEVVSTGDVMLGNVSASNNELFGANIQTDDGTVTINNSVFSGNAYYTTGTCHSTSQGYGLKVVTLGNINLVPDANGVGVVASDNGAEGAILEGNNVVVVNSTFNNNGATGITITSTIATLSNVIASNNGVDGAKICADVANVIGSTFENNKRYGLNVGSPQFADIGNIYTGNGTAGLFSNPTCVTNNNNNNNNNNHNNNNNNNHNYNNNNHNNSFNSHQFGNSYYGGGSDKSCHSIGKKSGKK